MVERSLTEGTPLPTIRSLDLHNALLFDPQSCDGKERKQFSFDEHMCTAIVGVTDQSFGDTDNCFLYSSAKDVHELFRASGREK